MTYLKTFKVGTQQSMRIPGDCATDTCVMVCVCVCVCVRACVCVSEMEKNRQRQRGGRKYPGIQRKKNCSGMRTHAPALAVDSSKQALCCNTHTHTDREKHFTGER